MKLVIILTALLLLASCSNKRNSEFKGDIKSISEKTYSCAEKFGKVIKEKLTEGRSYHFVDNKISEFGLYDNEGERIYSYEMKYEKGKPILRKINRRDFSPETYESIQIEDMESLISRNSQEEIWLRIRNNKNDTIRCKLDKNGYVCLQKENDIEGNTNTSEFERDKSGNVIKSKYSVNGKVENSIKSVFDEDNFEITRENENFKYKWKEITTYKYQTDKIGNWIERITYIDNVPKAITLREITYLK